MTWDSVPWFVGGGAQHSPEIARLLGFVAFRGNEGVLSPNDLKVSALSTPGGSVNVAPGACAILNRASGGSSQAYAGRLPTQDTVSIAATTSSGGRSDLIVARVEDPFNAGEPWADPADPTVGPYIFTRVISGVPAGTKTVTGLNLGYSAIPLARIDIPASTGTITSGMIVDLRKVANPRRDRFILTATPGGDDNLSPSGTGYVTWPQAASWSVDIPTWATKAKIIVNVAGAQKNGSGTATGYLYADLGGQIATQTVQYDEPDYAVRRNLFAADTLTIPASMRGTTQTLRLYANRQSGTGYMQADVVTTVIADVEWTESAA